MQEKEYRQLKASKTAFILLMGIGYVLRPELIRPKENYGVSNFWFRKRSKVPYIVGFAINSLGTLYIAGRIYKSKKGDDRVAGGLAIRSVLALLVLISSKLLGTKRSRLHYMAGGIMYAFQVIFSGWLVLGRKSLKNIGLFGVELVGTGLNLMTAAEKIQQMFVGQVLAQFGYIGLLLNNLKPGRIKEN